MYNPVLMKAMRSKNDKTRRAAWDILCALRGPDNTALSSLKHHYTSKIRGWALTRDGRGAAGRYAYTREAPGSQTEVRRMLKELRNPTHTHFVSHLIKALDGILVLMQEGA